MNTEETVAIDVAEEEGGEEQHHHPRRKRILVGIDGGEESTYALSWCLRNIMSQESGDILILLRAVASEKEEEEEALSDSVIEKALELCCNLDVDKIERRVEKGDARDVICSMVEKENADILVLGTHGYGFIRRVLLGSVSVHCAQHVKCPVLVVKKTKDY